MCNELKRLREAVREVYAAVDEFVLKYLRYLRREVYNDDRLPDIEPYVSWKHALDVVIGIFEERVECLKPLEEDAS